LTYGVAPTTVEVAPNAIEAKISFLLGRAIRRFDHSDQNLAKLKGDNLRENNTCYISPNKFRVLVGSRLARRRVYIVGYLFLEH